MPAIGDYFLTTMGRLWDLLEADSDFADLVREGNKVKYHLEDPDPENTGPIGYGNTPECAIYPTESAGFSLIRGPNNMITFGTVGGPPCAFRTDEICVFVIEYKFADLKYKMTTRAKTTTERVLAKSGAKLSMPAKPELPWIKGWGPLRSSFTRLASGEGQRRRRSVKLKMMVPVAFTLEKNDILG